MSKQTLGGNRIGSGNKMTVDLKGYERSTHDLSYVFRSSMSAGTLVPFMCEVGLPGDTFDIELNCDVKTLPTLGPLFGSYKVQLDVFTAPVRLYNSLLHNNRLNIGMDMSNVKLPVMKFEVGATLQAFKDDMQINNSCILKYFGLSGIGLSGGSTTREFNGVPLLAYWEIYKNYYANKMEGIGSVISYDVPKTPVKSVNSITYEDVNNLTQTIPQFTTGTNLSSINILNGALISIDFNNGIGVPPPRTILFYVEGMGWYFFEDLIVEGSYEVDIAQQKIFGVWKGYPGWVKFFEYSDGVKPSDNSPRVLTFPLTNIDDMRDEILSQTGGTFQIFDTGLVPYEKLIYEDNRTSSQEGLGIKTYQSDIFNNWLETSWINQIATQSAVSTLSGSFTIDQLVLSRKIYDMLNRIAVSGGSYDDWIEAVYDHKPYTRCESPVYHGGLIKELVFQEVVNVSSSAEQPLGTLAGRGRLSDKHKGGKIYVKCDEHCYIMGIVSLTPRIDYSQGNRWDVNLSNMDDFHKPQLDEIGFQDLITEQMAWWTTQKVGAQWVQQSAGKQPAWINYMTNYNRTYGNFADPNKEMFMTLNRRYEFDDATTYIKDLTTYIDPTKFNFIFAETQIDAQNFWTQIGCDITARRKMSARIMPNL
jgi:hypothetical protein